MTLTKNIWRVRRKSDSDHHFWSEKDREKFENWTLGAILEHNGDITFIDLSDESDEEAFEKFISEEDLNNTWTIEDTLPGKFVTEDYDPDYYNYRYKDSMDEFVPKESQ